jgi:PAS domain S-box-containing protein
VSHDLPEPYDPELDPEHDALVAKLIRANPMTRQDVERVMDGLIPMEQQLGFLRELVSQAADAICVFDRRRRLLLVNQAFCELVRKSVGEVMGRDLMEVIGGDPGEFERMGGHLQIGEPQRDYEFILRRNGDRTRVLSVALTPLRNPVRGNHTLTVCMARDVTGRWELERQVVEWQERARQYLYAVHPPEIAEAMVEGRVEARNLQVSVIFTDVTNFTHFTSQVEPDEVADALQRYFTAMSQIVLEHHGWVDKFVGDSIMALFGVPGGAPDHAQEALACSGEMIQAMSELDLPWRHKIGVATGQVIAGDIGSRQKPTYTAIGGTVNLASRLKDMARPSEVLVCSRTHRDGGERFRYEALGDLDVRGYGSAEVYRLLV